MNCGLKSLLFAGIILSAVNAQAATTGVNYAVGGSNVTGSAGNIGQSNWNNESIAHSSSSNSGGLGTLVDDTGATVSGMSTSWVANAAYGNGLGGSGSDITLLYGGLETQNTTYTGNNEITITGIPYAEYDLYLYVKGWTAGRTGYAQIQGIGGSEIGFNTYQNFPGSHSRATSTSTQGTYVLWEGLTASNLVVESRRGNNNIILTGFQVVQVPEPSTMMLLATGVAGLVIRRKKLRH